MIGDLLAQVESSAKQSEKKKLLENADSILKLLFDDCYNDKKYNIKLKEEFQSSELFSTETIENSYASFHKFLQKLANREVSGNAAKNALKDLLMCYTVEDRKWLIRVLNKNLKIGVSGDKFNEWNGVESKKFEVTLANLLEKAKNVNIFDGTWYASSKLDGCRCLTTVEVSAKGDVEVHCYSRQGKEFDTLKIIKERFVDLFIQQRQLLLDGKYVFDGEICIVDEAGNEDFQSIMKEITRKNHTIQNPRYILFDFATWDDFIGKTVSPVFSERYTYLKYITSSLEIADSRFCATPYKNLTVLRQELIKTQEDFDRWGQYVIEDNWEGFMLRKNIPFETGRSNNLLKVKKFFDAEYEIKDIEVGPVTGAEPGKGNVTYEGVKSLIIEHKGNKVGVGSGLTKAQRIAWKNNPELIIGKIATIKYFEETQNQNGTYSLRFPTLKYVYEDARTI